MKPGRKSTKAHVPGWARRITAARGELSQDAFAAKIGKSQQTVAGYEGGVPEPSLATYRKIAEVSGVSLAWLLMGEEGDRNALSGIASEANKENRLFAWAFHQAARLFADEGVNADFSYTLTYTRKLLGQPPHAANEAEAKESILRAIEIDRAEFRKDFDEARKKRL